MDNFSIKRYHSEFKLQWDEFVVNSKNATFLFQRDFMEYHQDRFNDYSLMIYKDDTLFALLPANKNTHQIHSHQGLSYGGLLLIENSKFIDVLEAFKSTLHYLNDKGFDCLNLKLLPKIYHKLPSDEIDYLLFLTKAECYRKDTMSVVDSNYKIKISKNRDNGFKRGLKNELVVKEVQEFKEFWDCILTKNLKAKHNTTPVHSLEEITYLKTCFPKHIRQFNVYHGDRIVAGTTIFETPLVAHSQYISGNEDKNILGSLDFLHTHLLKTVFHEKDYFDLGVSNEQNGMKVNQGLQYWKEGFGARTIIHDFYKIKTENYNLLNDVFI
ncbi:GNAT family N-acetyltransferase [Psychroserpens sp.]|uniref:GNAT family N-acetyltransferase n=1 Tax=Psychroserpens sp. TaxID=2020870 RepID=UPI0038598532